jgi:hypothetical protein
MGCTILRHFPLDENFQTTFIQSTLIPNIYSLSSEAVFQSTRDATIDEFHKYGHSRVLVTDVLSPPSSLMQERVTHTMVGMMMI